MMNESDLIKIEKSYMMLLNPSNYITGIDEFIKIKILEFNQEVITTRIIILIQRRKGNKTSFETIELIFEKGRTLDIEVNRYDNERLEGKQLIHKNKYHITQLGFIETLSKIEKIYCLKPSLTRNLIRYFLIKEV